MSRYEPPLKQSHWSVSDCVRIVTEEGRHLVRVPDPALDPPQLGVEVGEAQGPGAHPGQGGDAHPEILRQLQPLQVLRKT